MSAPVKVTAFTFDKSTQRWSMLTTYLAASFEDAVQWAEFAQNHLRDIEVNSSFLMLGVPELAAKDQT